MPMILVLTLGKVGVRVVHAASRACEGLGLNSHWKGRGAEGEAQRWGGQANARVGARLVHRAIGAAEMDVLGIIWEEDGRRLDRRRRDEVEQLLSCTGSSGQTIVSERVGEKLARGQRVEGRGAALPSGFVSVAGSCLVGGS